MTGVFDQFRQIWLVDFEYRALDGCRPRVACMVARELRSGQLIRMWEDELRPLPKAPFDTGSSSLIVAYAAAAEMSCFLDLGWPVPERILDLYVEYKAFQNGLDLRAEGHGLVAALMRFGIHTNGAEYKDAMRDLIIRRESHQWTSEEQKRILDYCQSDVDVMAPLLGKLAPFITRSGNSSLAQALFRGRYTAAVARMEREGVPIDVDLWQRLVGVWKPIRLGLIQRLDHYGFYTDRGSFSFAAFEAFLKRERLAWPRTDTGRPAMDADTIKAMLVVRPDLADFRELKSTLDKLKLSKLAVGPDGRNRVSLMPFGTITSRNAPSTTRSVFGPAKWIRHMIVPPPEMSLAYLDWKSQEIAIAGGLSGDEGLIADYQSDPYIGYAIRTGLAPSTATNV